MKPSDNPVVGRWRIVEADLWIATISTSAAPRA